MRRGGNKWFLRNESKSTLSGLVADLGTHSDILRQMRLECSGLRIYAEDVGCYYVVGVVSDERIERTGALFNKATGICVSQGMGYLPDFPVFTWETSFKILLQRIIRQQETETTRMKDLYDLRKFAYQDSVILAELDMYCGNNISDSGLAFTTSEQRDQRKIVATCDKCGAGLNKISKSWHNCTKCHDFDICLSCASHWLSHACEKCGNREYALHSV